MAGAVCNTLNIAQGCIACLHIPVYTRRGSVCELTDFAVICIEKSTDYLYHLKTSPSIVVRGMDTHMHCVLGNEHDILYGKKDASDNKPRFKASQAMSFENKRVVQNLSSIALDTQNFLLFDNEAAFSCCVPSALMQNYAKCTTRMQQTLLKRLLSNIKLVVIVDNEIKNEKERHVASKRHKLARE